MSVHGDAADLVPDQAPAEGEGAPAGQNPADPAFAPAGAAAARYVASASALAEQNPALRRPRMQMLEASHHCHGTKLPIAGGVGLQCITTLAGMSFNA